MRIEHNDISGNFSNIHNNIIISNFSCSINFLSNEKSNKVWNVHIPQCGFVHQFRRVQ